MSRANFTSSITPAAYTRSPISVGEAAQTMWNYYRDHKHLLVNGVKDGRESILIQIQDGIPVEVVFSPYMKPPKT